VGQFFLPPPDTEEGRKVYLDYLKNFMDEQFVFLYHLRRSKEEFLSYSIQERKYLIEKFVSQREKENQAIEKASKSKNP
jgi:hypothetical protein